MSNHETDQNRNGWREVVQNFTPAWFTSTMGSGAISIILKTFPYPARWLYWLSVLVFCFDLLLFTTLTCVIIFRFVFYPSQWSIMINHSTQPLFLAAWPMGFSQIIFLMIYICSPIWGHWVTYLAWAMWMVDSALSILIILLVPFMRMKVTTQRRLMSFTALEMFPFLACIVASGTGAVVATALPDPLQALATVIASYILLGIGLPMAFIITTIYMQRLMLHKLPPSAVIVSVFLPVGPPCMGGIAAVLLGQTCMEIFSTTHTIHSQAGVVFYSLGLLWALLLWGFATLWLFLAVIIVCYTRRFEFNLGWWAFTFPVALFASLNIKIGETIPSRFFDIVGAIVAIGVILLWMMVSFMTARGVISGKLFELPMSSSANGITQIEKDDIERGEDPTKDN